MGTTYTRLVKEFGMDWGTEIYLLILFGKSEDAAIQEVVMREKK